MPPEPVVPSPPVAVVVPVPPLGVLALPDAHPQSQPIPIAIATPESKKP
jgi:hypothetical protein